MNKKKRVLIVPFLACFFLIIISCKQKNSSINQIKGHPLTKINLTHKVINTPLDSIIEIKKVIPLETNQNSFLTQIDKVCQFKSNLYVLDKNRNRLYIFDLKGNFKGMVGNRGNGPGEYIDISDFTINKNHNEVLILSAEKKSIHHYDLTGLHVKTQSLPFQSLSFELDQNGNYALYQCYFDKDNVNLRVMDKNFENLLFSGFDYPNGIQPMNLTNLTGNITKNNEGFLYSDATSCYIYQITPEGKSFPKYYIDFQTDFYEEENKYDFFNFFQKIQKGELNYLTNLYEENEKGLAFTYNAKTGNQNERVVKRFNAYYSKKDGKLHTSEKVESSRIPNISGPLGLTENGNFISIIDDNNFPGNNSNVTNIHPEINNAIKNKKEGDNPIIITYDFAK